MALNNENLLDLKYVNRDGDSMRGPLLLNGEAQVDAEATTKSYVDRLVANLRNVALLRDGSQRMTGPLTLAGAPTVPLDAANMAYVDAGTAAAIAQAQTLVNALQALLLTAGGVLDVRYTNRDELPGLYERDYDDPWEIAGIGAPGDRITLNSPAALTLDVDGMVYFIRVMQSLDLSAAGSWDAIVPDYTVAANRAGVDFYVYACVPVAGMVPEILLSDNAVAPVGYTIANSRRVGGFHGLCLAVGAIGGHALTGFLAGDILPDSVWDYRHRPVCEPEGMVFSHEANLWVDIYLQSGVGAATASVFGGAITDTRMWYDHVDDGSAVLKRLLDDAEFQIIALGSNEETNIAGGADPVTTGGHADTAARRMISNIGCEDCCGVQRQWLLDISWRFRDGDHIHTNTITHKGAPTGSAVQKDQAENLFNANLGSGADETTDTSSVYPTPAWNWQVVPGGRGSTYMQGVLTDIRVRAGGNWNSGVQAGSQSRDLVNTSVTAAASITARFASKPRRFYAG